MKHFLKGTAVVVGVLVVLWGINLFCDTHGIHLDQVVTSTVAAICAIPIYHLLIRNEIKKDGDE